MIVLLNLSMFVKGWSTVDEELHIAEIGQVHIDCFVDTIADYYECMAEADKFDLNFADGRRCFGIAVIDVDIDPLIPLENIDYYLAGIERLGADIDFESYNDPYCTLGTCSVDIAEMRPVGIGGSGVGDQRFDCRFGDFAAEVEVVIVG